MLWQQCLKYLEQELPDQEINTWLRTLHGTHHDDALFLLAPNEYVLQHVQAHHLPRISECARLLSKNNAVQVFLQIGSSTPIPPPIPESNIAPPVANQNQFGLHGHLTPVSVTPVVAPAPDIKHLFTNNLSQTMTFDNFVDGLRLECTGKTVTKTEIDILVQISFNLHPELFKLEL